MIFDGSERCFERWRYAGGASIALQKDGTLQTGPGDPGLGVLWYAARPYGDFILKLQFRDDAPASDQRANSGVQVRFPAPHPPVPGCPTTFNGEEQNNAAWIAVNCGHEVQINDSPDGGTSTRARPGRSTASPTSTAPTRTRRQGRLERPQDQGRRPALHGHPQRHRHQRVRERARAAVPGRPNDPGSDSRGLVGYVGLQSHGGPNDVVSFRNVRIKDLSDRD